MIVLLDMDNKVLNLYNEDGINKINFSNIEDIYNYISSEEKVIYVTNFMETNLSSIVKTVSSIVGKVINTSFDSDFKYLHSTCKGPLNIPDPNAKPGSEAVIINFVDKYDLKILDDHMENKIKTTPILMNSIRSGKIEIINEIQKNKILAGERKEKINKQKKQDKKEKTLESVIIKNSAPGSAVASIDNVFEDKDDDIITIDFTKSINDATEEEKIMKKIGIEIK